jgi:hypothetical protein
MRQKFFYGQKKGINSKRHQLLEYTISTPHFFLCILYSELLVRIYPHIPLPRYLPPHYHPHWSFIFYIIVLITVSTVVLHINLLSMPICITLLVPLLALLHALASLFLRYISNVYLQSG